MNTPAFFRSSAAVLAAGVLAGSPSVLEAQIPAFPGAEGAGALALGGRGGDVYHVTNLNSSGPGSFAYGLTTGVPSAGRTIVFDVSGYATVNGTLRVTASKITIAGQTAPGDGFGLKGGTFRISGDEIVIRHLRFRNGVSADAVNLDAGSINCIFDHTDMMFGTDENFSSFDSPPENMTFQWSLNAWGLESHSCGGLWDQNHATCHHSLWAHNHTRNPKARPNGVLDWVNNVTYDWDIGFIMGDSETPASWKANVRGNYFVCPPGNLRSRPLEKANLDRNGNPNFSIFVENCLHDYDGDLVLDGTDRGYAIASGSYAQLPAPVANNGVPVTIDPPLTAYKKVVSAAGPLRMEADPGRPLRDEVAAILVNNLVTLRRHHISSVSQTGALNGGYGMLLSAAPPADSDRDGMPDVWELALGFNVGGADQNTVFPSSGGVITGTTFFPANTPAGYNRLEEYLHFRAIPHVVVARNTVADPSFVDVDLRRFTSGFTNSPGFLLSNVSGGSVVQSGPGGALVRFTPTVNVFGRAKFHFTVTDADGSTWTQQFGVLVSASGVPRDLLWSGDNVTNVWDSVAENWRTKGSATAFSTGDSVLFDDRGSASPAITLSGTLSPGPVIVDGGKNYTFTGSGSITGAGALTKSGSGTLTLTNSASNAYNGGTTINGGTLVLGNVSSLGSGPVTLAGATLGLTTAAAYTLLNPVAITAPSTISATNNTTLAGAFSGAGDLNLAGPLLTPEGTWAGYTGRVLLTNNGTLRFNQGANPWGAVNAAFDAGATGTIRNRSTITPMSIGLGALSGGPGSFLRGSDQAGSVTDTYVIGGLNQDTTFAGTITNGTNATPHTTAIIKSGTGTLTLSGTSTYTGATTVGAGTLRVNGTLGNTAATVESGAALLVDGTIGAGAVTVKGGGTLSGSGQLGGAVAAQAGAIFSPGSVPVSAGNLRVGAGLALNAASLRFDLADSPAGASDKLTLSGGVLGLTGTQSFDFHLLNGTLSAGTYVLIDGGANTSASGAGLVSNLPPSGTRQTFALQRPSAGNGECYVRLVVTGNAASLVWSGAVGTWDLNSAAGWSGGPTPTFFNMDAVTFNDTASNRNVSLVGKVQPRSVTVANTGAAYTLDGTGTLSGSTSLVKSGSGTLLLAPAWLSVATTNLDESTSATVSSTAGLAAGMTVEGNGVPAGTVIQTVVDATTLILSQAVTAPNTGASFVYSARNTYSGGTLIGPGSTIALATHAANLSGLGSGAVTLNGGTLTMFNAGLANFTGPLPNDLIVETTGTLNAAPRCGISGRLFGGGVLNLVNPYVRTDLTGDWSRFTGRIQVLTDSDGGDFRFGTSYAYPGFPTATLHLDEKVWGYFIGTLAAGAGTTVEIGELTGSTGARFRGGATSGRALRYRIGGKTPLGQEVAFAGTIDEQSAGTITNYVKTGAGIWRLSGACAYNGGTTVEQGTLRISGTLASNGGNFQVAGGATLDLAGGTVTTADVQIATNAKLTGSGSIKGDLTNDGTVSCSSGSLVVTGEVVNNGTMRFTGGAALVADGAFVNNGVLDLLTGAQSLPANLENNGVIIDSTSLSQVSATRLGQSVTLSVATYAGHSYQLQRADSLVNPAWANIGGVQAGDNTVRQFTDPNANGSQKFYRIMVTP